MGADATAAAGRARARAAGARPLEPGWAFVAPALVLIAVFFVVPVVASVVLSLTDFDIYAVASRANLRVVGLENYRRLVGDPLFWVALRNTFVFVVVAGPLSIGLSLAAAVLLSARAVRLKALFRTIFFLPVVTTLVAIAVVWRYIYHPRFGLLNHALAVVGIGPVDWLGDPRFAMPAIILMAVWKNFGFNMVNPNAQGAQPQMLFKVTDRVIMTYSTVKRLTGSLGQLIRRFEQQFGEIPTQPGAQSGQRPAR